MYTFSENTFSPALVNCGGVLVAAMCRGVAGREWGYIEIVTRRSTDGGVTWSDEKLAARPPARSINEKKENTKSAFFLNPVMATAPNGDIVMLVTFFPESKGLADKKYLENKKTAFTSYEGERCPVIYNRDGVYFIVMKNGIVLDKNKRVTPLKVKGIGELYQDEEYLGNIFLNGARGRATGGRITTFGAVLKTPKRSYIYMMKSKDKGLTWSRPKDITAEVLFEKDGAAVITCSGNGLVTAEGRIIMPMYSDKNSFAIYSDDNGVTWNRNPRMPYTGGTLDWTAVQTPDRKIYAFSQGKTAVSEDNGIVWNTGGKLGSFYAKAQKSALLLSDCIFVTTSTKAKNGCLAIADLLYDKKDNYKVFTWRKKTTEIGNGAFGASTVAPLSNSAFGVIYEQGEKLIFNEIDVE